MKESTVERYLVQKIKEIGGKCIKLTPPPTGIPDRLVLLPSWRPMFIELKKPKGGKISQAQEAYHTWLRNSGFIIHVFDCKEDVDSLVKFYIQGK